MLSSLGLGIAWKVLRLLKPSAEKLHPETLSSNPKASKLLAKPSILETYTWRLLCSSFLVMTCFLSKDDNMLPKKEIHKSLQVSETMIKGTAICASPKSSPANWSASSKTRTCLGVCGLRCEVPYLAASV